MSDISKNPHVIAILATMQNLEEIGGVKDTAEYLHIMNSLKSEIESRISIARQSEEFYFLAEDTRSKLQAELHDAHMQGMFGDGIESDYVYDGGYFVGINNYTDAELIEDAEAYLDNNSVALIKAKAELEVHKWVK